jgi:hypothetical protein
VERKVQRNTRRQRRSRSWLFSPLIIAQLAVVMVVAGVGVAFALPAPSPINTTSDPWAGTAAITGSTNVQVGDYILVYNSELNAVSGVTLSTTATAATAATLKMVVLNGGVLVAGTDKNTTHTYTAGESWDWTVTFTAPVAFGDVDTLNVIVTE